MIRIDEYQDLTEVYSGSKTIVLRGIRERDNLPVVIKLLKEDQPSLEDVSKFRQQYEILKQLEDVKGVIKAYDLEKTPRGLALILEDFSGATPDEVFSGGVITLDTFLRISIQLADALGRIHAKNIIHKDIKPRNFLLDPETLEVKIMDFGIATMLSRSEQQICDVHLLEGTLPYISPEQTGRMNRSIDYRSDLYSLGIALYEMLAGQLPFESHDPMELVHAHIAVEPRPPHAIRSDVPEAISMIILKLLEKTAEDRYQSAFGLKEDLTICLRQLEQTGKIEAFELGRSDVSERLQIPEKLYGREREIGVLLETFDQVKKKGAARFLMVSGYSGVGKSTLIQEVHKPVAKQGGYFIFGKYDLYKRSLPYFAFIQAFQELVRQLLTESDTRIQMWRRELLHALGPNGRIIIDVIPEVELIIGHQPEVPNVPPAESQNRFNFVFQRFVGVFTQKEHPLVLFLDDLQWADESSLKLMQQLIADSHAHHLLLLGAYRDNEVGASDPLMLTLDDLKTANVKVTKLNLRPLTPEDLTHLISETVRLAEDVAGELSDLVYQKTQGNPFFVNEFLKTLYQEGMLWLDVETGSWLWDTERILASNITDNVVDLMVRNIHRLPRAAQETLGLAACIGHQFDTQLLASVMDRPILRVARDLWAALEEGLMVPLSEASRTLPAAEEDVAGSIQLDASRSRFQFLHDRVHEAAYSLLPEKDQEHAHLRIARLLSQEVKKDEWDERIFDVVNHYLMSIYLVEDESEQYQLAELCLIAGQRAKASTAYAPALRFLAAGAKLLGAEGWKKRHELAYAININRAECEVLTARTDDAEQNFVSILAHAKNRLEQSHVYSIQAQLHILRGQSSEAIKCCLSGLQLYGIGWAKNPSKLRAGLKLLKLKWLLRRKKPEVFLELPELKDPEKIEVVNLSLQMGAAAYWASDKNALLLSILEPLEMALKYGVSGATPFTLMTYGIIEGPVLENYASAKAYGDVALELNQRIHVEEVKCRLHFVYGALVRHWRCPMEESSAIMKEGFRYGMEVGDLHYAAYCGLVDTASAISIGGAIDQIYDMIRTYMEFADSIKYQLAVDMLTLHVQYLRALQGETNGLCSLHSEIFDEAAFVERAGGDANLMPLAYYHQHKAVLYSSYGQWHNAFKHCESMEPILEALQGQPTVPDFYFLYGLAAARLYAEAHGKEKRRYFKVLQRSREKMATWARNCQANALHMYQLLEAEMARVKGDVQEAAILYERAVRSARKYRRRRIEALASELAATLYLEWGIETSASAYLGHTRYLYEQQGATAKVEHMQREYADLLPKHYVQVTRETTSLTDTTTIASERLTEKLDLDALMLASQSISGETVLAELLEKVMKIAMQNAGGEHGYLMLVRDGDLFIEAEGTINSEAIHVLQSEPVVDCQRICHGILQYVQRTGEDVVLDDALTEGLFTSDPYIMRHEVHSMACFPIVFQGRFKGVFYLENNLTKGAFSKERLEVLQFLVSQAALAIGQAESEIDTLTRLWMRRNFMERARDVLATADQNGQPCTLLMIDLDHFKQVNDTYGHAAGDTVLREAAARMIGQLRDEDLMGRYGGEEFVLLLPTAKAEVGLRIAERLARVVREQEIEVERGSLQQTVSIGLSVYPEHAKSLEDLIQIADMALYEAKENGRNQVCVAGDYARKEGLDDTSEPSRPS